MQMLSKRRACEIDLYVTRVAPVLQILQLNITERHTSIIPIAPEIRNQSARRII